MVLNIKDAARMEVIRKYTATDPVFWSIDNRPIDDVEQRTRDLDRIFTPARGFRVRAQIPSTATLEVEKGVYVPDGFTVTQVLQQNFGPIPAAAAGNIRIDLIWFDLSTATVMRTAGAEQLAAVTFPALVRPILPPNNGAVPLSYVYIDDVPTPFSDSIALNIAGALEDVRPAPGFGPTFIFESNAANLQTDVTGGAAGSSAKIVRADHRHPLNVDGVTPEILSPSVAGASGVQSAYARRDHIHELLMEAVAANLKKDTASGVLGILPFLVRSDHQHPLNVDGTVPDPISLTAGATGSADTYARRDHTHRLPTHLNWSIGLFGANAGGVGAIGGGTGTYNAAVGTTTVPAAHFPNGIIVWAWAEFDIFNETDANLEVVLTQVPYGGALRQLASNPSLIARNRASVINGGGTGLGFGALYMSTGCNDGQPIMDTTVNIFGIWIKNVGGEFTGCGGEDWNPALATDINFTNLYVVGSSARVNRRGFVVLGF